MIAPRQAQPSRRVTGRRWIFGLALWIGALGLSWTAAGVDAPVQVSASAQPTSIRVGDLVELRITAEYPAEIIVQMPGQETALGAFEVRSRHSVPPVRTPEGRFKAETVFEVTVFQTGDLEIPALDIHFTGQAGEASSVSTQPVPISVLSTLPAAAGDIQDIKPPLEMPRNWWPIVLLTALGALLLAALVYAWRRRKARQARSEVPTWSDPRPAHEIALERLDRLRGARLLDRQEIDRYHVEASEIVRSYLEARFQVDALEMTSAEVLTQLSQASLQSSDGDALRRFLNQCDLVKFARHVPERAHSEALLETARAFVEATRAQPQPTGLDSSAPERPTPGGRG